MLIQMMLVTMMATIPMHGYDTHNCDDATNSNDTHDFLLLVIPLWANTALGRRHTCTSSDDTLRTIHQGTSYRHRTQCRSANTQSRDVRNQILRWESRTHKIRMTDWNTQSSACEPPRSIPAEAWAASFPYLLMSQRSSHTGHWSIGIPTSPATCNTSRSPVAAITSYGVSSFFRFPYRSRASNMAPRT